jgi:Transposase DDE domain
MEHLPSNKGEQRKGLLGRLSRILDKNFLEHLGVFTGFERRKGLIDSSIFVNSCLLMTLESGWAGSLNQHCVLIKREFGVRLKEQSLDERFNAGSEWLMRQVFELVAKSHLREDNPMELLELFNEVYIQDSSNFKLPVSLKHIFKGSGGSACEAGLKIDALYGLRWGTMQVRFHHSAGSDSWQGVPGMKTGSLLLRDLGYFSMDDFERVAKSGSYFLSRLKFNTNVYETPQADKPLDLLLILRGMADNEIRNLTVYLGAKKRLKVRLILQKVPRQVAEHKRYKLKTDKQNKRKGLSEARLEFCDANAYITNISEEMMGSGQIITLYGLRWIIEILFKAWKSISNLKDKVNVMKPHRFMCMLYAHMIKTLLDSKIVHFLKIKLWNLFQFKVSELKAFSVLDLFKNKLWAALTIGQNDMLDTVFDEICNAIWSFAKKRKSGKKETHNDFYVFVKSQT